ncbi:MAG: hypothetical protein FWC26_02420, partial [Fibromonadales bacterium]|nr:hypothetical protein [Fibromonadales bacterium]
EAPITPYLTIAFIVNGTLIAGLIFYNMDCKNTGDAYFIFFSAGIISILLILLLSAHLEAMP